MFREFINLLFPQWCSGCQEALVSGEEWICTICRSELVVSSSYKEQPNEITGKFYGKLHVEHAFSMFSFNRGGTIQTLLHKLKYEGYYDLGVWLGKQYGKELKKMPWIEDIDVIVPIPLHKKKLAIRGYNQSEAFGKGLGEEIIKPINEILFRHRNTATQTKKNRLDRWKNVADIFGLAHQNGIKQKSVLLVDDVVTSGATLEAAGATLINAGAEKLYFCTIASA